MWYWYCIVVAGQRKSLYNLFTLMGSLTYRLCYLIGFRFWSASPHDSHFSVKSIPWILISQSLNVVFLNYCWCTDSQLFYISELQMQVVLCHLQLVVVFFKAVLTQVPHQAWFPHKAVVVLLSISSLWHVFDDNVGKFFLP